MVGDLQWKSESENGMEIHFKIQRNVLIQLHSGLGTSSTGFYISKLILVFLHLYNAGTACP